MIFPFLRISFPLRLTMVAVLQRVALGQVQKCVFLPDHSTGSSEGIVGNRVSSPECNKPDKDDACLCQWPKTFPYYLALNSPILG